jgi:hypothetical protein
MITEQNQSREINGESRAVKFYSEFPPYMGGGGEGIVRRAEA